MPAQIGPDPLAGFMSCEDGGRWRSNRPGTGRSRDGCATQTHRGLVACAAEGRKPSQTACVVVCQGMQSGSRPAMTTMYLQF